VNDYEMPDKPDCCVRQRRWYDCDGVYIMLDKVYDDGILGLSVRTEHDSRLSLFSLFVPIDTMVVYHECEA